MSKDSSLSKVVPLSHMKRFGNLFMYETTNFDGCYRNCKLLEDVVSNDGHIFAMACEVFPTIVVNMDASEIYFFEEFGDYFTIHFKMCYV